MIAGGLETALVRAILLLAVYRGLRQIHVPRYPLRGIEGVGLAGRFAVDAGQAGEVLRLGRQPGLNSLQAASQRRAASRSGTEMQAQSAPRDSTTAFTVCNRI